MKDDSRTCLSGQAHMHTHLFLLFHTLDPCQPAGLSCRTRHEAKEKEREREGGRRNRKANRRASMVLFHELGGFGLVDW